MNQWLPNKWLAILVGGLLASPAYAGLMLTVDEIIFSTEGGTDVTLLSGTVWADISDYSNVLTLTLTNTSLDGASTEDAALLLSGVAITLPSGFMIETSDPGGVDMNGSDPLNFDDIFGDDVSGEWGYNNDPLGGGWNEAVSEEINTGVSSLTSSTDDPFSNDVIELPANLDGPEFGLWSLNYVDEPGGLNAILDSVVITLNLNMNVGTDSASFLLALEGGDTVLMFGSPDATSVPEPGTLGLLGVGLLGLAFARRKKAA